MFTGIVEEIGRVTDFRDGWLTVASDKVAADLKVGDSVSVNGVCLTIVTKEDVKLRFELQPETLRRTWLGQLNAGAVVNLEGAMPASGRFGGHFVQGHVDGVGRIESVVPDGDARLITISAPADLSRYIVRKGFISVDGISLTVVDTWDQKFSVAIVSYTWLHTNLHAKSAGDPVNIEVDIIAKYVEQLLVAKV